VCKQLAQGESGTGRELTAVGISRKFNGMSYSVGVCISIMASVWDPNELVE